MPTEATAVAVEVPPPTVIKLRQRRHEVPKVNVYSRHTSDCKWSGKSTVFSQHFSLTNPVVHRVKIALNF